MSKCPVLFSCDGTYAMQLATVLRSLAEANQRNWPIGVYVFYDALPLDLQAKVSASLPKGSIAIEWIAVNLESFREFASYLGISKIFYSRLLVGHLVPQDIKRVLYLDTDTLVLGDLEPLWTADLGGMALGAVLDRLDALFTANEEARQGIPSVHRFFNSGVLLIDLEIWRSERISEKALQYLADNPQLRFPDQNALNVVCDGKWKNVGEKWNYQNHFCTRFLRMAPSERPAIVHFVTGQKPWVPSALSVNADLYNWFRRRTRFAPALHATTFEAFARLYGRSKRILRRNKPAWLKAHSRKP